MAVIRLVRLVGIAIGSITAAWLVLRLLMGFVPPSYQPLLGLAVVVLGGLIYADIRRRDHRPS